MSAPKTCRTATAGHSVSRSRWPPPRRCFLLDEPLTGMDAGETEAMVSTIERIRARDTTVMLVEHNMRAVMRCCDRIAVLDFGKLIAEGPPRRIQNDPRVIDAYLGADEDIHGIEQAPA